MQKLVGPKAAEEGSQDPVQDYEAKGNKKVHAKPYGPLRSRKPSTGQGTGASGSQGLTERLNAAHVRG
ncbi:uncharacterized protein AKAW2_40277S [Aspergillus luchuensis]|uniref:Uncharacterized protein n=1 Tax=Aspergillus kawachii TaxID=1069201 RepID=A0A7R7W954_ASPKA|nr:uncharacterized protein AKAW2_40277S [Aspergillus luchuensis]BCR98594.1 hypothetical protein AKAW2_40277S [Aspergillus luchuensis]BCS10927.1 hypothetical protein ALUC_40267S [Aspergillus luchuensis]